MSDKSDPVNENGLIIQPSTGFMSLPDGDSPALSGIISRSLAHNQTSRVRAIPERRAGDEQEFEIAHGVKVVMCWIPPGNFLMGSPEEQLGHYCDETQHRVTITQGFWLGKYQITQAQWEAVMGSNPSNFKGSNLPVEEVSWDEISESGGFMEKINRFAAVEEIFSLPTEAQWEYACRANTVTTINSGKNLTTLFGKCANMDEVAWYSKNSGAQTHPVGQRKANGWGLHDMHGNVWEWCVDWHEDYSYKTLLDPRGPDSGTGRVFRGGDCNDNAGGCRVAIRGNHHPTYTIKFCIGFRLAGSSVP